MSDNWVVQNLENALETWNEKLSEIWTLITTTPQNFKGGNIWKVIVDINGAVQAIGLALLVLFFVIGMVKTCGSFTDVKKPEQALKLFVRFALAKGVITYGMELMLALFNIVQGTISTIMNAAGFGTPEQTTLPAEMVTTIEDCGFFESMGNRYGRVLFLREYASYIKDSMVAELTDMNRNLMMSIDIVPVPTDEAVKEAENRLLGVETNITNWQRRQNANNNFSATVPYIYSFGIMLYVLANHLKFPDSNTYSANPRIQYMSGYVLPEPEGDISKELYDIIARACRYNPDDRYQSIEEMLLDIETLIYGENFGFKKEYKRVYMVVGLIMLALGMGAWKLTLVPEMTIRISFLQYIFLAGCLGKGIFKILKKDTTFISVVIFAVGVYLMASSGFSWLKLFFLLWMTSSSGLHSGVVASGILIANFTSLLQSLNGMNLWIYSGYGWIAITLISIAYILLTQYIWLV